MIPRHSHRWLPVVAAALAGAAPAHAQGRSDLSPPPARDKIVAEAERVAASRGTRTELPSPLPNPFVARSLEVEAAPVVERPVQPTVNQADLLARIATRIPATGTVTLGGEPILLLGQKRLKVGDTYTISFEGQTYELSIAAVTPTAFTVQRGENLHTRPVHQPATSTNTPQRP